MSEHDTLPSLKALDDKIKSARKAVTEPDHPATKSTSYGMRAGLDMVSGVAVGAGVGYALDRWLNTMPLFLLICLGLGTAAGVKLLMETARRASAALEREEQTEHASLHKQTHTEGEPGGRKRP
jgi:ATP synthase protein I